MDWKCLNCSSLQESNATHCTACLYAKPLDKKGIPQIFAGYCIHFNGIVPLTLLHPSHAVEWRMAERHGATCSATFSEKVNLLVYRVGYERSDKCRACLASGKVLAVPITWMLDSLLETRQIHPYLYQLTSIPEVANPTSSGVDLAHYQHPFFLLKASEYAISSSFAPTKAVGIDSRRDPNQNIAAPPPRNVYAPLSSLASRQPSESKRPPYFDITFPIHRTVNIYEAALQCLNGAAGNRNSDFREDQKQQSGVEILTSEQYRSRVDEFLFTGMVMVLSTSLSLDKNVVDVLNKCGAKVLLGDETSLSVIESQVTHVVYHRDDKKSDFLIQCAHIKTTKRLGLLLCESSWIEDCLMLGEVIPPYGMYSPSETLMKALKKKYEKNKK